MWKKIEQMVFYFEINTFELFAFAFTEREYFPPGVNMLTNSLNISILLTQNFLSLFSFRDIRKYDKDRAVQI